MTPSRVAVIGAGYFGAFHVEAWRGLDVDLVGVVERDAAAAARTGAPHLPTLEAAVAAGADLIDIATPPPTHLPLIEEALGHGVRHIICQKPFCGGLEGAERAVAMAEAAGARLAVHENFRFQPWHRAIKAALPRLGEVYQATFRLRPGDGQGPEAYLARQPYFQTMERFLVHETAIHLFDVFRALLGEPSGLFARLARLNPAIRGEDAGVIVVDFASGARAVFDGNRLADHRAEDRRRTMGEMVVEGSEGSLTLDGDGRVQFRAFGGNDAEDLTFPIGEGFGGGCVAATCAHILAAFRSGESAEVEAREYLASMRMAEAAYASAASGAWTAL